MAKHMDLDTEKSLQEPITFAAKGRMFTCVDLTDEVMDEVKRIADDDDLSVGASLVAQLAVFTGQDVSVFDDLKLSFTQKTAAIAHITECIGDPLDRK